MWRESGREVTCAWIRADKCASVTAMGGDRIIAALEELQAERDTVLEQLQHLQRQVERTVGQVNKLNEAIQSLISLRPELINHHVDAIHNEPYSDPTEVPALIEDPDPVARLKPFITPGGDGKNLQSAQMVAAIVDAIGQPAPRHVVQREFFKYFTEIHLSVYWQQPEKAFRTALRRAVERNMVLAVDDGSGTSLYTGGFRKRSPTYAEVTR
jgi:hypothetical protein